MIDIASQLKAIHRQVEQQLPADGSGEVVSVLLRRGYDAPIGDVWDAVTDRAGAQAPPFEGGVSPVGQGCAAGGCTA
jgi:hypothetical protein